MSYVKRYLAQTGDLGEVLKRTKLNLDCVTNGDFNMRIVVSRVATPCRLSSVY
jgi:hypothetical protein